MIDNGDGVNLSFLKDSLESGSGIQIIHSTMWNSPTQIINTGDTDGTDDVLKSDFAGGDVTGTFNALYVQRIRGKMWKQCKCMGRRCCLGVWFL